MSKGSNRTTKVAMYDLETGEYIDTYESFISAELDNNLHLGAISRAIRLTGGILKRKGYRFEKVEKR